MTVIEARDELLRALREKESRGVHSVLILRADNGHCSRALDGHLVNDGCGSDEELLRHIEEPEPLTADDLADRHADEQYAKLKHEGRL